MVCGVVHHCVDGGMVHMKLVCVVLSTALLTGCAAYTVTNAMMWMSTGKSITDHSTSGVLSTDCDSVRAVKELTYYCETTPDIHIRYNRNGI